jgi:hypothetical protein
MLFPVGEHFHIQFDVIFGKGTPSIAVTPTWLLDWMRKSRETEPAL